MKNKSRLLIGTVVFASLSMGLPAQGLASEPIEIVSAFANAGTRMVDSAMSANGRIAYATDNRTVGYDDHLWKSTDGGRSYTEVTSLPASRWLNVDMSADGQIIYASHVNDSNYYMIAKSVDGGETWSDAWIGTFSQICDVATSDSGLKFAWVQCDNGFYYTEDGGDNWSMNVFPAPGSMNRIDIAGDGSKVVGVAGNAAYITSDGGANWSSSGVGTFSNAVSVHVSDDGVRIMVATQNGPDADVWVSTDGGGTFAAVGLNTIYGSSSQAVFTAMSGDGLTMLWMFYGSKIWVSRDGGDIWTESATNLGWLSAALSRDGMRGVITAENQSPRVLRREAPGVSDVLPTSGSAASVTELTVTGNNFFDGCVVYVDGVARPTTFVSSTELTVTLGSGRITGRINVMCDDMTSDWYWFYTADTTTTTRPRNTTTSVDTESTLPSTGGSGSSSSYWAVALLLLGLGFVGFRSRARN